MMFAGTVTTVEHLTNGWLKHAHGCEDVVPMTTPPRVLVVTEDGRAVSLAYHEEVSIEGEK